EDLFYRVNVLSLELPPLRAREGDVDRLIDHYLPVPWHVEPAARDAMNRYPWPGNVRQLINVIQRATILADGHDVTLDDLPSEIADVADSGIAVSGEHAKDNGSASPLTRVDSAIKPESLKLDDIAKAHVLHILAKENGNKAKAARVLGIHRRKLYRLLERFEGAEKESAMAAAD
ncbi:MAG: hypothetical protein KDB00_09615, partial [Planctomycetales bacterium]|nr:hypothetical protein [Planctomycetales bacterium]